LSSSQDEPREDQWHWARNSFEDSYQHNLSEMTEKEYIIITYDVINERNLHIHSGCDGCINEGFAA
jgi:hypothetical protein